MASEQKNNIKAVLCDIDGTLLDSNGLHAEAWQRALQHFGFSAGFDELLKEVGKGGDNLLPQFVPKAELPKIEEELKKFRANLFHREYIDRIVPFTDARRLLRRMREAGLRIAVASSTAKGDLEAFKTVLKIHDLVEEDTTSEDAEKTKPAPDIFTEALRKLSLPPEQALALGDTRWDIESASRAGVRAVAVLSGGGWTRSELEEAGAVAVYRDVADILRNYDASPFATGVRS